MRKITRKQQWPSQSFLPPRVILGDVEDTAYRHTGYHGQDDREDDKMAAFISLLINIAFGLTPLAFIFILYVRVLLIY